MKKYWIIAVVLLAVVLIFEFGIKPHTGFAIGGKKPVTIEQPVKKTPPNTEWGPNSTGAAG